MKKYLLHFFDINCCHAIGLLVLRIGVSASLMTHGCGKFMKMMQGDIWGLTHLFFNAEITMALVIFAELFCAFFVLIGFGTRIFSIPVMYNFIIAITNGDKNKMLRSDGVAMSGGKTWSNVTPSKIIPFQGTINKIELSSHAPGRAIFINIVSRHSVYFTP